MRDDLPRRDLLVSTAASLLALAAPSVWANQYPDKPIRFLVGFPPGGTYDILARLFSEHMSRTLGQSIFVENQSGANGAIALSRVARMPADGYAMTEGSVSAQIRNPLFNKQLQYNGNKDFATVATLARVSSVLAVRSDLPARNLQEFAELAKRQQLSYATPGNGSAAHLAAIMLSRSLGFEMLHVPFQGDAPGLEVGAGRVDMSFTLPTRWDGHPPPFGAG